MDLTTRVSLVQNLLTTREIHASVGAKLLDINRISIYYKGSPVSDEELACKEIIDHLHTDNPIWGERQMSAQPKNRGCHVGRRKARHYMNEMDIYPIHPKMNLSKRLQQAWKSVIHLIPEWLSMLSKKPLLWPSHRFSAHIRAASLQLSNTLTL